MLWTKGKTTLHKCISEITEIVVNNNITIFNLLEELKNLVISSTKLTSKQKIFLIDNFLGLRYRLHSSYITRYANKLSSFLHYIKLSNSISTQLIDKSLNKSIF